MRKFLIFLFACLLQGMFFPAQADEEPVFHLYKFDDGAIIQKMSDNGLWAVAQGSNSSNALLSTAPKLINLATQEVTGLTAGYDAATVASAGARDVSDDGSIVVGELNGKPAYWSKQTAKYVELPLALGCSTGYACAVTPDGKYAVGTLSSEQNIYEEIPVAWNLETGKLLPTAGLPEKDMAHENKNQNRFLEIAPDGRHILGCMSFSYLPTDSYLGGKFIYVYDLQEGSYKPLGFDEQDDAPWIPYSDGLIFISEASFSNNGNWITGSAYVAKTIEGSEFPEETEQPFLYNVSTGDFKVFNGSDDSGYPGWTVDNDGNLLGATPANSPYREWGIRSGNYWYAFSLVMKQRYGLDFSSKTGLDNTGTPLGISNDGKRIAVLADPYSSYVVDMPENLVEACGGVDLLGSYTVSPMAGTSLSKLQKVDITFDRNVQVLGGNTAVELREASGSSVQKSIAFRAEASSKTVSIRFRSGALEVGKAYTLSIPAGSICIDGDAAKVNKEINIAYNGRANVPVKLVSVYPENNTSFARMDASANPVILTFDTEISVAAGASAELYRADETEPYCSLMLASAGRQVAVFPISTQYLYKDVAYRIVVPASSVTDLAGNNPNEAITLDYTGSYEREVSFDDKILFSENFDNGLTNMLLFDGDRLTPSAAMVQWGFADETNYPWWVVRDDETSSDMAAASHSMYVSAGQSQDWMVIPQLSIPDDLCLLKFQSQSYKSGKSDYLKVIVWESDNVYNVLSSTVTEKILAEGKLVYDKLQSPGATEEKLSGEWTDNVVSLAEFAGKNVYIAFLNDNNDQSAVMVDNVEVLHNVPYLVTLDCESSVVGKTEMEVKGRVTIDSETETFSTLSLQLKDGAGNLIGSISEGGLALKKGDTYSFSFDRPLPLVIGRENAYTLVVKLNDTENTINAKVKDLAFAPTKRVVLEEYTGMTCQNCPLGILAIEKIRSLYGDLFIPVSIHTYSGDIFGSGLSSYSDFFAFTGAPSGMIGRSGIISYPMSSEGGDYTFNGQDGDKLWLDIVQEEMEIPAESEISASISLDADKKKLTVPCTVRYALDAENQNVNIFMVILEDNVLGYQTNNLLGVSDPDLGEWGQGGKYASSSVYPYYHEDVARAWVGRSVSGTGGYLPSTVEAGKEYTATLTADVPASISNTDNMKVVVMLINANTEAVINAVTAKVSGNGTGIASATADAQLSIAATHGGIAVKADAPATVKVYAANGALLGTASGSGLLTVGTDGYKGVVIVKATTAQATLVRKAVVK